MAWWQFRLATDSQQLDDLEAALFVCGALSISLIDAEDQPILEPAPGEMPIWDRIIMVGLFSGDESEIVLAKTLSVALERPVEPSQLERLEDQAWERAWMADFKPMHFGGDLWVVPTYAEPPQPDATNMRLDPGLAFGSGTHNTTALCLRWLATADLKGKTVLDFGCGSGVLAVAALLLGADKAIGTDIDPQAITASKENALANGVEQELELYLPEAMPETQAEVVLANILYEPLRELRDVLLSYAAPGAQIVLSGVLDTQASGLQAHYADVLDDIQIVFDGDWCMLSGFRRSPL